MHKRNIHSSDAKQTTDAAHEIFTTAEIKSQSTSDVMKKNDNRLDFVNDHSGDDMESVDLGCKSVQYEL